MTDAPGVTDATDATDATDFLDLTRLLTAEPAPDPAIGEAYRQRLASAFPHDLPRLLDAHRKAVTQPDPAAALQSALDADSGLARVARETIAIWFTAEFTRPDGAIDPPGSAEQYQSGLIWQVIRAHPISHAPELPPPLGGYGYWARHP
ncbi:sorbitol dehydrogenase family protein [Kitasatospora sp. A2-31]|uniref:sorbitol dehydrogenase family protein n=1 Tax=Kitasatospora sp. A2-31 TaxID=2916414 RepID=UPI001EEB5C0B|nr:sorbitol dehydrogenase family protein [Kitasatospora sp. A2-31]MCG6495522.1 sorbitol dehydrogenase family protein [Kitasatospora sp. A2-31]